MRLLLALAAFTLVLTPDASACWDKTDKLIQELKQLDLDTEQLKDIFEYQREHRLLIAQAHQEGLGCSFHEGKTVDFQKSAIGVLDDAQFKSYTGRESGDEVKGEFNRQGVAGAYREQLPPEDIREYERLTGPLLEALGYPVAQQVG